MQIVHLTTVDQSGSGRAAMRIVRALKQQGVDTYLLCLFRRVNNNPDTVHYVPPRSSLIVRVLKRMHLNITADEQRRRAFVPYQMNDGVHFWHSDCKVEKSEMLKKADIIHLHWIDYFVDLPLLFGETRQPIVWTLHDMGAFTGICNHYYHYCTRYQLQCGSCPVLDSHDENDISRKQWLEKNQLYQFNLHRLYIVTCSQWLADCAKESGLLRNANIRVIPNCIDTSVYKPLPHQHSDGIVRVMLGAVDATDPNKGCLRLCRIIKRWAQKIGGTVELLVVGHNSEQFDLGENVVVRAFGFVEGDKDLAIIYNTADLLLYGSYRDNLPNMIMEAMACGIPVISFSVGGCIDMVEHKLTGYLAQSEDDYLEGIDYCLAHWEQLRQNARTKVEHCYSQKVVADMYHQLYQEIYESKA